MLFVFFVDTVINLIDRDDLSIVEQVILEVLDGRGRKWSSKVQSNISFFFDILMLVVVFWFAEALHEGSKSFPSPVCFR